MSTSVAPELAHNDIAAIAALREALAQAERHHDACWDETVRLSNLCERTYELKRELRARALASGGPSRVTPTHNEDAAQKELLSRIRFLETGASQAKLQAAFYELYTAELLVDKARAELHAHLADLPAPARERLGGDAISQDEASSLPSAEALDAITRHIEGDAAAEGPDPVEQLNYRRWLVELSQGATAYILQLKDEMAKHVAELAVLERQASSVEFFDRDELAEIEWSLELQRCRVTACQKQIRALTPAADALDKRLAACALELDRFL